MPLIEVYERTTAKFEAIEVLARTADPFGIDNRCLFNPAGHQYIGSCGDVVCVHCSKVVWS